MAHFEKQLTSTLIHQGKIIDLRVDTVELENGNTATREVVVHHGGVAVLPIDQDGNVLLVRQFRYPTSQELLEIPAGKRGDGETPRACGIRELEEETGCWAEVFEPLAELWPTPAYVTEKIYIYYATGLTATAQHLDDDEFLSVERVPLGQAVDMVLDGVILDAKTQIAILKYNALQEAGRL